MVANSAPDESSNDDFGSDSSFPRDDSDGELGSSRPENGESGNGEETDNPRSTIVPDLSTIGRTNDEGSDDEEPLEIPGFSGNYDKYEASVAIQPHPSQAPLLSEDSDEDLFQPTEEQLRAK